LDSGTGFTVAFAAGFPSVESFVSAFGAADFYYILFSYYTFSSWIFSSFAALAFSALICFYRSSAFCSSSFLFIFSYFSLSSFFC